MSIDIGQLEQRAKACVACNSDCINTSCYNYISPEEILALILEYRKASGKPADKPDDKS